MISKLKFPKFPKFTLSMAIVVVFLVACGDEKPEVLIISAKENLAKNDKKTALIQIKNALQISPDLAEGRFLLGSTILGDGDPAAAEIEFEKARSLKYSDDLVIPKLAKALLEQGKYKKITDELSKIEIKSTLAKADFNISISNAYAAQGLDDLAQSSLNNALVADPENTEALLLQAKKLAGKNDIKAAISLIDSVIKKAPKSFDAYKLKGDILLYAGKDENGALEQYKKSVEIKPDYFSGHSAIFTMLMRKGSLDEAEKRFDNLKALAPNSSQVKYFEAQIAYGKKDYKLAKDLSQQLLKIAPNNPNGLQLAGAVEFQLNSFVQAEVYLSKALSMVPSMPLARRMLILTYLRSGQPTKALATLTPLLAQGNVDPAIFSIAGEVYLQNGDVKKSAEYFTKASKLDPQDGRKRTSVALVRLIGGDVDAGFNELHDISTSDKGTTADLALISAHLRRNELDKALKAIDVLEKKQPENPLSWNLRGKIQIAKKDFAMARKSFESSLALSPAYFPAVASLASLDISEKKFDDAKKRFESVLTKDPKSVPALLALAELQSRSGGTKEQVTEMIGKAVAASPTDIAPRLLLIDFYLRAKDFKLALSTAQSAATAMPDSAEALDYLGRAQQASGDSNQALSTYNKLSGMQPMSPQPLIRLAEINIATKNKDAAAQQLTKALELKPDMLEVQRGLIVLDVAAERFQNAIATARQVQRQRPKDPIGYILEGDIWVVQKKWDDAATAFRLGIKQTNASEVAMKLHSSYLLSENKTEADKFSSTWTKEHPKDATFLFYMADAALLKKDLEAAEKLYTTVVQIQPDNAIAFNNMAWVAGQLKKDSALGYAEKAIKLAPDQPAFLDTMAMLLLDKGDYKKSIEIQNKVVEIQPNNYIFKLNLAKIYIKSGDKSKAKIILNELEKIGDKFSAHAEVSQALKSL